MLKGIQSGDWVVALDVTGSEHSTEALAKRVDSWVQRGQRVVLTIGGPDGLDSRVVERANEHWSLSRLTLPHALVRVVAAEALYRAVSFRAGHPYHRG